MAELPRALGDEARRAEADAFEADLAPLLLPAHRLAVGMLLDPALAEDRLPILNRSVQQARRASSR